MEVENPFNLKKFRNIFEGKSKIDLRAKNVKIVLEKFYNKEFLIENLRSIQEVNLGNFQNIFKNFFRFLIFFLKMIKISIFNRNSFSQLWLNFLKIEFAKIFISLLNSRCRTIFIIFHVLSR